jgi:hypothetical protein
MGGIVHSGGALDNLRIKYTMGREMIQFEAGATPNNTIEKWGAHDEKRGSDCAENVREHERQLSNVAEQKTKQSKTTKTKAGSAHIIESVVPIAQRMFARTSANCRMLRSMTASTMKASAVATVDSAMPHSMPKMMSS